MFKQFACALSVVVITASAAQAMPNLASLSLPGAEHNQGQVQLVGGKKLKNAQTGNARRRSSAKKFSGNGGGVRDTCPGGDQACIDQLVASCDKAGGGLSTQPDGGVDCYVVGIHDQP